MDPAIAVVKDVFAAVRVRDVDRLAARFARDCVFEDVPLATVARGRAAFRRYMEELWEAIPTFRVKHCELMSDGATVAAELLLGGAHRGELLGVPPSGRSVAWRAAAFYRVDVARGLVVHETYYYDVEALRAALRQAHG
ncbi:MAG: ester cyclase [Actinobacteria bacterium]|nr:ester cyclase [Actinomycetota bacterium]